MASRTCGALQSWLLAGLVGGCGPAAGLEAIESATESSESSGADEGAESTATTDAIDSTDGGLDAAESVLLVLHRRHEPYGGEYFGFRVEDSQAEGPLALAPTITTPAEDAFELPDRRVVFRSVGVQTDRYWLGELGASWPVEVDRLADALRPPVSRPTPVVPGRDAIVFISDAETAMRVDFAAGEPTEPVVVAHGVDGALCLLVAEPQGRYVVFATKPDADGNTSLARASLEVPAPDAIDVLVETGEGELQQLVGFTPQGDGVFAFSGPADALALVYVDTTGSVAADAVALHDELGPDEFIAGAWDGLDPGAPGIAYMLGDARSRDVELQYVGIEDGVPAAPITLGYGEPIVDEPIVWSPDGEWLVVNLAPRLEIVHFADGHPGQPIELFTAADDESYRSYVAGDQLFVLHTSTDGVGNELLRVPLDEDGPGVPEVVVPYSPLSKVQSIEDITPSGDALLYTALVDGAPELFLLALGESPIAIASPPDGEALLDARLSPEGSFVAWRESAPEPTNNRVWLTARPTPSEATMVFEDVTDWRFATNW